MVAALLLSSFGGTDFFLRIWSPVAGDTVQSGPSEAMSSIPGTDRRENKLLVSVGTKPFQRGFAGRDSPGLHLK